MDAIVVAAVWVLSAALTLLTIRLLAGSFKAAWQVLHPNAQKRVVRMHLKGDGGSIEGTLAATTRSHYILWSPKLLQESHRPGEAKLEVQGHVEIERANVLWYQVIG